MRLYRRAVSGGSLPEWSQTEQVRALIPAFAVVVAVVAAVADVSSAADLVLCALAAAPFVVWTYCPGVPLLALSLAVIVPAVAAQRSGQLEPLLFEVSLLAFVVARGRSVHPRGRCAQPARRARARGRGRDPGSLGYRRGHLDLGCRVPVAVRPRGRAAGGARRPASGHQARASSAGPAGRAAPDRPRRPRPSWGMGWLP